MPHWDKNLSCCMYKIICHFHLHTYFSVYLLKGFPKELHCLCKPFLGNIEFVSSTSFSVQIWNSKVLPLVSQMNFSFIGEVFPLFLGISWEENIFRMYLQHGRKKLKYYSFAWNKTLLFMESYHHSDKERIIGKVDWLPFENFETSRKVSCNIVL